jgi:hypothetical protein
MKAVGPPRIIGKMKAIGPLRIPGTMNVVGPLRIPRTMRIAARWLIGSRFVGSVGLAHAADDGDYRALWPVPIASVARPLCPRTTRCLE